MFHVSKIQRSNKHVIAFDNSTTYYQFHLIFSNMINNLSNTKDFNMIC